MTDGCSAGKSGLKPLLFAAKAAGDNMSASNNPKLPPTPTILTEEEYTDVFADVLGDLLELARRTRNAAEDEADPEPGTTVWAVQQCLDSGADDYTAGAMAALCILTSPRDDIAPRIMALRKYKTGLMSIAEPAKVAGVGKIKH